MNKYLLGTTLLLLSSAPIGASAQLQDLTGNDSSSNIPTETETGEQKKIFDKDFNALSIQEAFNEGETTDNVALYEYNMLKTYPVYMRVNMATMINLPEGEVIKAFSWADEELFSVINFEDDAMLNKLILQSGVGGVDTNLIIVGESGNIYNFYLRNLGQDSDLLPFFNVYITGDINIPSPIVKKEKVFSKEDYFKATLDVINQEELERAQADYLKSLDKPEGVNLGYYVSGDEEIAPRAVYDRRGWTYFDFRDVLPSDRLPVLYKVVDGYDAIQNFRFKDGFLIAEGTSSEGWTLRNGDKVVCVEGK